MVKKREKEQQRTVGTWRGMTVTLAFQSTRKATYVRSKKVADAGESGELKIETGRQYG